MHLPRIVGVLVVGGALVGAQVPVSASPAPSTLVIGVDHQDAANQRPDQGRLFEYTDFFSRSVKVHQSDTLDFNFQGFHILGVAKSEAFATSQQPLATPDRDDPPSVASGKPKISVNPVVFAFGSGCGWTTPCDYTGGNDLKISGPPPGNPQGPPQPADWKVTINASPGTYTYFCYIHPGMRGTVKVVAADEATTSQAHNDAVSQQQFLKEKAQAERAEKAANVVRYSGEPGERTYFVKVGISAADNHVAIDEMFPNGANDPSKQLNLVAGDRVAYSWPDGHNVHSVTFPPEAVQPFGFDCDAGFVTPPPGPPGPPPCMEAGEGPELIADPGNAPSGTKLTAPATVVDSGDRPGKDFNLPTSIHWAVTTGDGTALGSYHYNCNIHDFMRGTLNVMAGSDSSGDLAHT
jgi:plastocyanin